MSFNLSTVLMNNGVNVYEMQCTFSDEYLGAKSEEAKRSACSLVAIKSILFNSEFLKPKGIKAIQNHEWSKGDVSFVNIAPHCLHSTVFQSIREGRDILQEEVVRVAAVFASAAKSLQEFADKIKSEGELNEGSTIALLHGQGVDMNGIDRYSNILQLANHYENLSSSTELLTVISRVFLKKGIPIVIPRIHQLQQRSIVPLTPYPKKSKEVKEIVDLSTHTPKIRRPRRTNHAKNLQLRHAYASRSNKIIEERKDNPVTVEQIIPVSTEPQKANVDQYLTDGEQQQVDGWGCTLL
jgi:hypothetical protein